MSLFVGLNTGLSALRAAQVGLDTASHNIANSATPGYTRQRVELAAMRPFDSPDGMIGTGVDVVRIQRLRDQFLDARVRSTAADFARTDVTADLLGRAEALTGEPDNGISGPLATLWDRFEDLAMDPDDTAVRRQVLSQLDSLATTVRSTATGWSQLEADATVRRDTTLDEANGILSRIADINNALANADPARVSNDVLDERDLLADRIAELVGGSAVLQPDGTLSVSIGGATSLVTRNVAATLTAVGPDVLADGVPITATLNGEVAALHTFVTTTMPARRASLDAFAADLVSALNTQHALGFRNDGLPGGPLFTATPGAEASSLQVAVAAPSDLAVAGALDLTTGLPAGRDGTNAQALADLRSTGVLGGASLAERLNTLVVDLGTQVQDAQQRAGSTGDLAVSAQVSRQSQHGVNIDEEMVDVLRYQRQLEAASRVMTAIDEALDVLVNRTGVVGR